MHLRTRLASLPTGAPFYALALAASAIALAHASTGPHGPVGDAVEAGIVGFLGLGFVFAGHRASRSALDRDAAWRIFVGTLLFGTIAMGIAALIVAVQDLSGFRIGDRAYVLFLAWTLGAAFGTPMTYFYELTLLQNRQLGATVDRAESLARQLSINQRVLRHNIRNDLNVILAGADGLVEEAGEDADPDVEAIVAAGERLLETAERSLAIQRALQDDAPTRFDLPAVLGELVERRRRDAPAVAFELDVPAACAVEAHPRLREAVDELLANAVEHNDPDGLTVRCALEDAPGRASHVRLVVEDTGAGLPPRERLALGGRVETQLEHTSGLGLWFVRTVVDRSGGALAFEERSPHGSRVIVELPRA